MFAAVGTDGSSVVVWGVGKTQRSAARDAEKWMEGRATVLTDPRPRWADLSSSEVYVLPISAEQARQIEAGESDAQALGLIDETGAVRRGTGAPSEQYLATRWDRLSLRLELGNKAKLEAYARRRGLTVGAAIDEWIGTLGG